MTEQQAYDVLRQFPGFELRRYPAHLLAEVEVVSSFTDAGNRAFRVLVAFISGRNRTGGKVAMTAPALQEQASTRIGMTSPVVQEASGQPGRQVVAFVMPAEFTLDTLPTPSDPRITVREIPAQLAAARTFTGRWSERIYLEQLATLHSALSQAGLAMIGHPRFARFDPPWTPWFLRHNEVVQPVTADPVILARAIRLRCCATAGSRRPRRSPFLLSGFSDIQPTRLPTPSPPEGPRCSVSLSKDPSVFEPVEGHIVTRAYSPPPFAPL